MKAIFSKQVFYFALAMTISLVGLNGVHALQGQGGSVADEQAILAEMAKLDQIAADKAIADAEELDKKAKKAIADAEELDKKAKKLIEDAEAAKKAIADAEEAEKVRRASLTPEQRDAEDAAIADAKAKDEADKKAKKDIADALEADKKAKKAIADAEEADKKAKKLIADAEEADKKAKETQDQEAKDIEKKAGLANAGLSKPEMTNIDQMEQNTLSPARPMNARAPQTACN